MLSVKLAFHPNFLNLATLPLWRGARCCWGSSAWPVIRDGTVVRASVVRAELGCDEELTHSKKFISPFAAAGLSLCYCFI